MIARYFYTATLMFTAAMAFNRFFAICLPGKWWLRGKLFKLSPFVNTRDVLVQF